MPIQEVLPGVQHWTSVHPAIQIAVSSYLLDGARTLLDPLLPEEGLEWFEQRAAPERVLLTNRLHTRHTQQFVDAFGCEVWINREGLNHFGPAGEIRDFVPRGFEAGATLPGEIQSYAVGALCPDETAFLVPGPEPALAIADGVVRDGDGPLTFVPDFLMGDDPEAVKRGLKAAYRCILDLDVDFDHLLLAHGQPWIGGAREALHELVASD
jgi:hypothetical protein